MNPIQSVLAVMRLALASLVLAGLLFWAITQLCHQPRSADEAADVEALMPPGHCPSLAPQGSASVTP